MEYFHVTALVGILMVLVYFLLKLYRWLCLVQEVPYVAEINWWGPGKPRTDDDTSVTPYKFSLSDKDLDDLKKRLSSARTFTPSLEGVQHQYGINTNLLKEIHDYWKTKYNWREREVFLNQYPQFSTTIQGLRIRFLHVKPIKTENLKVIPLLLLHGWVGSVREFYECIPKLTTPRKNQKFVFALVVPHLPGFGLSDGAVRSGLNPLWMAVILKILMLRLQYDQWYVQGGDWGSEIAMQMAIVYPKHVLGIHLNMAWIYSPMLYFKRALLSILAGLIVSKNYKAKLFPWKEVFDKFIRETGYFHLQATRPDSIGVALNDSPIGLAAYLLEKFIVLTNENFLSRPDGGLPLKFNYDKLLDNIMIYWIGNSITTSMRIYTEAMVPNTLFNKIKRLPILVPTAYAQYGDDLVFVSEADLKRTCKNLIQYSEFSTGGHFSAFEEPEWFAHDVWSAVEKFEDFNKN